MTEFAAPAPGAASPAPATPAPGASDVLGGGGIANLSVENARAAIRERINDKAFYERMRSSDPAVSGPARAEWAGLHAQGFPSRPPLTAADVGVQEAARSEEQWNSFFAAVRQQFAISDDQMAEVRAGVISPELYRWAREEKDRLIKDASFRKELLVDQKVSAKQRWGLLTLMLGLKPKATA